MSLASRLLSLSPKLGLSQDWDYVLQKTIIETFFCLQNVSTSESVNDIACVELFCTLQFLLACHHSVLILTALSWHNQFNFLRCCLAWETVDRTTVTSNSACRCSGLGLGPNLNKMLFYAQSVFILACFAPRRTARSFLLLLIRRRDAPPRGAWWRTIRIMKEVWKGKEKEKSQAPGGIRTFQFLNRHAATLTAASSTIIYCCSFEVKG